MKQIGKIIRELKPKIATKTCENQFNKVAVLFIYPLMDLKQNFGQHLDLFVSFIQKIFFEIRYFFLGSRSYFAWQNSMDNWSINCVGKTSLFNESNFKVYYFYLKEKKR